MEKDSNKIVHEVVELLQSNDLYLSEALQILKQVEIIISSYAKI